MSIYDIFDKITNSANFTVGGGAASAVAGAMAASLISMVSRLSTDKNLGLKNEQYIAFSEELDLVAKELKQGACDDEIAFLKIKEAFAMAKLTEEEKNMRSAMIEKAALVAAGVPLENARRATKILAISKELEGKYNISAASDMKCGKVLAKTAVIGCSLNIDANLPLIKDQEKVLSLEKLSAELKRLTQ